MPDFEDSFATATVNQNLLQHTPTRVSDNATTSGRYDNILGSHFQFPASGRVSRHGFLPDEACDVAFRRDLTPSSPFYKQRVRFVFGQQAVYSGVTFNADALTGDMDNFVFQRTTNADGNFYAHGVHNNQGYGTDLVAYSSIPGLPPLIDGVTVLVMEVERVEGGGGVHNYVVKVSADGGAFFNVTSPSNFGIAGTNASLGHPGILQNAYDGYDRMAISLHQIVGISLSSVVPVTPSRPLYFELDGNSQSSGHNTGGATPGANLAHRIAKKACADYSYDGYEVSNHAFFGFTTAQFVNSNTSGDIMSRQAEERAVKKPGAASSFSVIQLVENDLRNSSGISVAQHLANVQTLLNAKIAVNLPTVLIGSSHLDETALGSDFTGANAKTDQIYTGYAAMQSANPTKVRIVDLRDLTASQISDDHLHYCYVASTLDLVAARSVSAAADMNAIQSTPVIGPIGTYVTTFTKQAAVVLDATITGGAIIYSSKDGVITIEDAVGTPQVYQVRAGQNLDVVATKVRSNGTSIAAMYLVAKS